METSAQGQGAQGLTKSVTKPPPPSRPRRGWRRPGPKSVRSHRLDWRGGNGAARGPRPGSHYFARSVL